MLSLFVGRDVWPTGCCLRFIEGSRLASVDRVLVPSLDPGCGHDLVLTMTSPAELGLYNARWHLSTFTGTPFGGLQYDILSYCFCCLFNRCIGWIGQHEEHPVSKSSASALSKKLTVGAWTNLGNEVNGNSCSFSCSRSHSPVTRKILHVLSKIHTVFATQH